MYIDMSIVNVKNMIWFELNIFYCSDLSANLERIRHEFWKTCKCAIFIQCGKHVNGDLTLMVFHLFQLIRCCFFFRIMHRSILSFHSLFEDNGTRIDCFHQIKKSQRDCAYDLWIGWMNSRSCIRIHSCNKIRCHPGCPGKPDQEFL